MLNICTVQHHDQEEAQAGSLAGSLAVPRHECSRSAWNLCYLAIKLLSNPGVVFRESTPGLHIKKKRQLLEKAYTSITA